MRALAQAHWRYLSAVAALVLGSWLYLGYAYLVFPQPGTLDFILRHSGELQNDWYTSGPPAHWFVEHTLALLPNGLLEPAFAGLWVLTLIFLWGGFVSICRSFDVSYPATVAAGLVALPTSLGGFGLSDVLFDFFYPTWLAFAFAVCAIAALLHSRRVLAGVFLGLAILIHPGLGPLSAAVIAPAALVGAQSKRRAALEVGLPLLLIGAVPIVQLLLATGGGALSTREQYEFFAIVRGPPFALYSAFSSVEYVRTAIWAGGLLAGLALMWRHPGTRQVLVILGCIAALCGAGAWASQTGHPLILVTAQTARLSAYIVFLGVILVAAGLNRIDSRLAAGAMLSVFLLLPFLTYTGLAKIHVAFPSWPVGVFGLSAVEATSLLVMLVISVPLWLWARTRRPPPWLTNAAAIGVACLFVAAAVSLVVEHHKRVRVRPAADSALMAVAEQARNDSAPTDTVMSPPELDGFRTYSHRPDIVEFGSIRLGDGDLEWRHRFLALTQNPTTLDPAFGTDLTTREKLIGDSYDHVFRTSTLAICRYDAKLVVARSQVPSPTWLVEIYRNDYYALYRVRPDTCRQPSRP